jgi:hypothetical protein
MTEAMHDASVWEQVRGRAVVMDGVCTEDELTVRCYLVCWVLTATGEALPCVDQDQLGVVSGLLSAELALLSAVTTRMAAEAIGPVVEAYVYRKCGHQPYPPDIGPG